MNLGHYYIPFIAQKITGEKKSAHSDKTARIDKERKAGKAEICNSCGTSRRNPKPLSNSAFRMGRRPWLDFRH